MPEQLDPEKLKLMLQSILDTRPVEMDCSECFDHLDYFAEMIAAGKNASQVMPLVHDHLKRCKACREEFDTLVELVGLTGLDSQA
jgi:predicted anti-sigma-YlaC factor YlaD